MPHGIKHLSSISYVYEYLALHVEDILTAWTAWLSWERLRGEGNALLPSLFAGVVWLRGCL